MSCNRYILTCATNTAVILKHERTGKQKSEQEICNVIIKMEKRPMPINFHSFDLYPEQVPIFATTVDHIALPDFI